MDQTKISVIMGAYNCQDTLADAIESILTQTYFNWELIVCDDCSSDSTYQILLDYKKRLQDRLILIRNSRNSKLAYTLNQCLKYANGRFVARMDSDDISLPDRFEKQVNFLTRNPNIDLVGTAMQRFSERGRGDIVYGVENPDRYTLRSRLPFNHATIMTYKHVYDALGGYTVAKRTERAQDYDLWFRFFHRGFRGRNIMEPLYLVREDEKAIRRRTFRVRFQAYKTTIVGYRLLGYPLHWYVAPTVRMLVKGTIPSKMMLMYREFQRKKHEYSTDN